jgi:class 3 adenylate cyclase
MEEPRIPGLMETPAVQFAHTNDGVSIAYSVSGSGPVVLWANGPGMTHAQAIWSIANPFREALVKTNTVAMVDVRGFGLSARDVGTFTVEAFADDIDAVAAKLGAGTFDLVAADMTTKPALAYAAQNPDRVRLLALVGPPTMAPVPNDGNVQRLLGDMLLADWEMFCENVAGAQFGWDDPRRERIAQLMRSSATPQAIRHYVAFTSSLDVRPYLASIRCPCVVFYIEGTRLSTAEEARELASELPNATFRSVSNRPAEAADSIGQGRTRANRASGGFRTILFTDIVEHTAMMERLGDAKGRDVLRDHERITREALKVHGGTEVKTDGDSFMASFLTAQQSIEFAIELQRALEAHSARAAEPIALRIGINAGEPIADEDDLFGASVILAARAKEKAGPQEILVTDVVRRLVAGKGFKFIDRGLFEMKGLEEPARLHEVVWRE